MTRGWGQGGDSFRGATSVWGDARFLEMAVGDGCSRFFEPLKIVEMVNFMLCTLHPNSRKKTQEKNLPLQHGLLWSGAENQGGPVSGPLVPV